MSKPIDQERESFEKEIKAFAKRDGRNYPSDYFKRHGDGYWKPTTQLKWEVWQLARAAVQPAGVAMPDDWRETVSMAIDLIQDLRQGTAVERRLRAMLAAAPHPVSGEQEPDTLAEICDLFMIGRNVRTHAAIMANVKNTHKFANLLHAIEGEFFMVPCEPGEDDEPDDEQQYECLLNCRGLSQEQYIKQFREALNAIRSPTAQDVAGLVEALRTVVGLLQHKAETPLERQAVQIANVAIAAQQGEQPS